jgi:hypothetical protein
LLPVVVESAWSEVEPPPAPQVWLFDAESRASSNVAVAGCIWPSDVMLPDSWWVKTWPPLELCVQPPAVVTGAEDDGSDPNIP